MSGTIGVVPVDELALRYEQRPWRFAVDRRGEIDRHFAAARARLPALWNGQVLLLHEFGIADAVLTGACLEADFASFLAWRDWGFPDPTVRNVFAMAALKSADGAFLMGVMGPHTSNAGEVYFASGTPEPADVAGDMVDLEASVLRELAEETGLQAGDVDLEPGWTAVIDGPRIALMKGMGARKSAVEMRARILTYIAAEAEPELADLRIVRPDTPNDPAITPAVAAFLRNHWGVPGC